MARPVCIVGGSGQIGAHLLQACAAQGWPAVGTYYRHAQPGAVQLDAADRAQVRAVIQQLKPVVVINSINARGGTDACESDPTLAQQAHVATARHLADAAAEVGAKFVQLSTDYVFDGQAGPYGEDAAPAPLSQLGRAKLEAERYAQALLPDALIIRTSFVFSWAPQSATPNFAMQLWAQHQSDQVLRVPTDQVGNVTYAPNLAEALAELIAQGAAGVYHVAGTTRCSKYAWALKTAEYFHWDPRFIEGVTTAALGQAGPRPLASGFRLEKVQAALRQTRLLNLEESLERMARAMGAVPMAGARA